MEMHRSLATQHIIHRIYLSPHPLQYIRDIVVPANYAINISGVQRHRAAKGLQVQDLASPVHDMRMHMHVAYFEFVNAFDSPKFGGAHTRQVPGCLNMHAGY